MSEPIPAISVLLPVRNGEAFLDEAVDSVLAQTGVSFELVVIDDGSSDRTPEMLRAIAARDARVRVVRQEGLGLVAALNAGLTLCRAPLIARMDADDICEPGRLAGQLAEFAVRPSLLVLGGAIRPIDHQGRGNRVVGYPRGPAAIARHILVGSPLAHPAVMFRKDPVVALGGYRPRFKHCEDYDLWLRCSENGEIDNLQQVLLRYRVHPGGVSRRYALEQTLGSMVALACHLVRRSGAPDPTDALPADHAQALAAISLPPAERRTVLWTLLAHNAHVIGDVAANPVLAPFAAELRGAPRDRHARAMIAAYHLRAARFHGRARALWRMARHLCAAVMRSPFATAGIVIAALRQATRGIIR